MHSSGNPRLAVPDVPYSLGTDPEPFRDDPTSAFASEKISCDRDSGLHLTDLDGLLLCEDDSWNFNQDNRISVPHIQCSIVRVEHVMEL